MKAYVSEHGFNHLRLHWPMSKERNMPVLFAINQSLHPTAPTPGVSSSVSSSVLSFPIPQELAIPTRSF